jgi:hypothetical protein
MNLKYVKCLRPNFIDSHNRGTFLQWKLGIRIYPRTNWVVNVDKALDSRDGH